MSDPEIILRLNDPGEARVVCQLLESYGIPSSIVSHSLPQLVYPTTVGELLIAVPGDLREDALRIIETHRAEGGTLDPLRPEAEADADPDPDAGEGVSKDPTRTQARTPMGRAARMSSPVRNPSRGGPGRPARPRRWRARRQWRRCARRRGRDGRPSTRRREGRELSLTPATIPRFLLV